MEGILDYADIMIQQVETIRTKIDANSDLKQMKKEYDEWKRTMNQYASSLIPQQKRVCSSKRYVFQRTAGILENIIETNGEGFVESGDMKKNILQTQLEALGRSGIATIMNKEFVEYEEKYKYELAKTQYRPAISTLSRALLANINVEIATIDSLLERADALINKLQATKIPDTTFMTRAEQAAARAEAAQRRSTTRDTTTEQRTEEATRKHAEDVKKLQKKAEKERRRKQQAAAIARRLRRVKEIVERLYYRV